MKKKPKFLYMEVTRDKYELPVAVADSPAELAKMVGVTANRISVSLWEERNKNKPSKYRKIPFESEVMD